MAIRGVTPDELWAHGDNRERQAVLKALPLLPEPERFVALAIEACRSNVLTVFEAIACENPYPQRHFRRAALQSDGAQGAFNGVALARIVGLAERCNPELARMAADFAAERRAAGRPVPDDLVPRNERTVAVKMFDPHIHMTSRTTDDYEAMAQAGIRGIIEPAFWLGQPRTHVGTFEDYFQSLIGWERFRASQFGIPHFCTIALNPKEANNPRLADGVLELLPRYLEKDGVVAVGEIGFDDQTAAEEKYFAAQLELARTFDLPVLIHTPASRQEARHRAHHRGGREHGFPEERVLIDHNNEETLPLVLDTGCWAGHSIYPDTKMDEPRMAALVKKYGAERIIVNSAADWGVSDPLKVPKTASVMRESGSPTMTSRRSCGQTRSRSSPRAAASTSTSSTTRRSTTRPSCSRATRCCVVSNRDVPRPTRQRQ